MSADDHPSDQRPTPAPDRRGFLRAAAYGILGGGALALVAQSLHSDVCFNDSACQDCKALGDGCQLPDAVSFRQDNELLPDTDRPAHRPVIPPAERRL